jgi:hypothetical protein
VGNLAERPFNHCLKSLIALCAALLQVQSNGCDFLIAYASRSHE